MALPDKERWMMVAILVDRLMKADDVIIVSRRKGKRVVIDSTSDDVPRNKKILHLAQVQVEGARQTIVEPKPDDVESPEDDLRDMPTPVSSPSPPGNGPALPGAASNGTP